MVGSGPNGLAAAITLAERGLSVLVREANDTIGGGARSGALTLPGYVHDLCSAVHPLGAASPFLRTLPLAEHGLEWIFPPAEVVHPLDDGTAIVVERSVEATAAGLAIDAGAYRRLIGRFAADWPKLEREVLGPLVHVPRHPIALGRFGLAALLPATALARLAFRGQRARALLAGGAAHSMLPLGRPASASFGLVLLVLAHAVGWPVPRGGAQRIADALASYLCSLGGEIETGAPVESLRELSARAVICDVTPRELARLASAQLPSGYRKRLTQYRYGPGAFKVDYALDAPIPWEAPACAGSACLHLGGTLEEIAASERRPWAGHAPERPFVILAQPSLFDPSRAPAGKHTAWAYCHVPNGSKLDLTERIEAQIERFAPGFGGHVLARRAHAPADLEAANRNLVGGDINGGAQDLAQLVFRPTARTVPYSTPVPGLFLCSSSTPPGGGVHGMCGRRAAKAALRAVFQR
ncbi:MAG: phytoene desaturase family protein [Gaiellaceae bacterium]